ncbi:hypothetical protein ACLOJK_038964 [Asimina triloba]
MKNANKNEKSHKKIYVARQELPTSMGMRKFIRSWIGLHITAASLACSIAMLVDYVHDIRRRKFRLPCKLFSLNANSSTLLAIAIKLPVDLSTPIPGALEQFAKLSGTALICISIGHIMVNGSDSTLCRRVERVGSACSPEYC